MTRIILPLALLLGLAACGTIGGAGRDLSAGGDAISEAAEDASE